MGVYRQNKRSSGWLFLLIPRPLFVIVSVLFWRRKGVTVDVHSEQI